MAKSGQQSAPVATVEQPKQLWWLVPSVILGCICAVVFPYLHMRFAGAPLGREAAVAVANLVIFIATFLLFRRVNVVHASNTFVSLLLNIAVAAPVFILAWYGLAYEISEFADFGAMYVIGTWIATSELAEKMQEL